MAATVGSKRSLAKRLLVGRRMANNRMIHTLLPKSLALPVFSADALSSVAYCVEASMLVLVGAGVGALRLVVPIQIGIAVLMAIVVASYRQTVRAYPTGGGSYIVLSYIVVGLSGSCRTVRATLDISRNDGR